MSNKLFKSRESEKNRKDRILGICSFLFCVVFFIFFGKMIYQEYFDYEREYEYTTGTVIDISEEKERNLFHTGKLIYTTKTSWYVVKVKLEDEEILEFQIKDRDEYNCGDIVNIRKIFKIQNGERIFLNYNLLSDEK